MNIKHRSRLIVAVSVVLAAVALVVYVKTTGAAESPKGPGASAPPPPEVAVMVVKTEAVSLSTELPGRTSGYLVSEVKPQVNGLIQKRLFTEGSDVKAGEVLYQIDPAPFQAAYDSALANLAAAKKTADKARAALGASVANVARQQASVALAKTDAQRAEELFKDKAVSATERDHAVTALDVATATLQVAEAEVDSGKAGIAAAEAAIKQAEAAVETARINLDYTKIKAPISGRIGRSAITEGAAVTAYQPVALATIQQLDPIYVDVTQSTAELARLRTRIEKGHLQEGGADQKKVKLLLEDGTVYAHEGTLGFREVTVDPTTGSVILRIVAPNPDGILLPGMFLRAVVEEGVVNEAILIPQQAVSRDQKGNPVTMIVGAGNKIEPRQLVVEREIGDKWLVTSGLAAGDRVIVEGLQKARPGTLVNEVPFEAGKRDSRTPGNAPDAASKSN